MQLGSRSPSQSQPQTLQKAAIGRTLHRGLSLGSSRCLPGTALSRKRCTPTLQKWFLCVHVPSWIMWPSRRGLFGFVLTSQSEPQVPSRTFTHVVQFMKFLATTYAHTHTYTHAAHAYKLPIVYLESHPVLLARSSLVLG